MTGPSTPLDLDAIRARYDKIKSGPPRLAGFNALRSARDVPDLLAEVERLRAEVTFWRDQQRLAASTAATIAGLDEEAPALRQMLRTEKERRRREESESAQLEYALQQVRACGFVDDNGQPRVPVAYHVDGKVYHPNDVMIEYGYGVVPDASS